MWFECAYFGYIYTGFIFKETLHKFVCFTVSIVCLWDVCIIFKYIFLIFIIW